jgi:hypothetical protein
MKFRFFLERTTKAFFSRDSAKEEKEKEQEMFLEADDGPANDG